MSIEYTASASRYKVLPNFDTIPVMKRTIGVDEVGRGPIAGPLCVCAFWTYDSPSKLKSRIKKNDLKLTDSKKLSTRQREAWLKIIRIWKKEGNCDFAISYISSGVIDKIGMSKALRLAVMRSLSKLSTVNTEVVLLDGSLYAPEQFKKQKTIIKGDEREPVISLASIVAKVFRDRLMHRHSKKYPEYGFENHVGYGTRAHYRAITEVGLSPLHRQSFLKNFIPIVK